RRCRGVRGPRGGRDLLHPAAGYRRSRRGALVGVGCEAAGGRTDRRGDGAGRDGDGDGGLSSGLGTSDKTARERLEIWKADRSRRRFGLGRKPALVNVDLQNAYTRADEFPTAYETDPRQLEHVNTLARLCRAKACPVVWTYVAYLPTGEDCGVWGTRSD